MTEMGIVPPGLNRLTEVREMCRPWTMRMARLCVVAILISCMFLLVAWDAPDAMSYAHMFWLGLSAAVALVSGSLAIVFRFTEPIREVVERDVEYDEPPVIH